MGGGKEKQARNQQIASNTAKESHAYDRADVRNQGDVEKFHGRENELYAGLTDHYRSLAGDGGVPCASGPAVAGGGGGGGGGGRGAPDTRKQRVAGMYDEFMGPTGGFDPERMKSIEGDAAAMRGMASDPEIANRFRGNGVYDEFSRTGGLSEGDRSNIRARGNSGVPAMFGRMREEANRVSNVQGGYGPGRTAMMSRMGREQAGAAADASLNTELGITDKVNQGRQWGAQGMSESENALQDQRLQSLAGASGNTMGLQQEITAGRQYGQQGIEGMYDKDRAAAQAAASEGAANNRWNQQFAWQKKQAGLEGLHSLYGGQAGGYQGGKEYDLGNRQTHAEIQQGNIGLNKENNKGINWGAVAGAAGTAAMFMSARSTKERIVEVDVKEVAKKLRKLPIYLWSYKGDSVRHLGPMAEEFKDLFGVGDGVTLNVADIMGVLLAAGKDQLLEGKHASHQ